MTALHSAFLQLNDKTTRRRKAPYDLTSRRISAEMITIFDSIPERGRWKQNSATNDGA